MQKNKKFHVYIPIADYWCLLHFDNRECLNAIKKEFITFIINKKPDWQVFIEKRSKNTMFSSNNPSMKKVKLKSKYFDFIKINLQTKQAFFYYKTNIKFSLQFIFVLKCLLVELFLSKKILFLHASAISKNNKALIFTAPANEGKSTIAKLSNFPILGDDGIIIKKEGKFFYAYRSPFEKTKENIFDLGKVKLEKIYLLHKGKRNKITAVNPHEAFQQVYRNLLTNRWIKEKMVLEKKSLFLLTINLIECIKIKNLYFDKDPNYLHNILS